MSTRAVTADEYEKLCPRDKGYVCYMQAAWNKAIKDVNPYPKESKEWAEFNTGSDIAIIDCIDMEE